MNSNFPLTSDAQQGIDVALKFMMAIRWGFWLAFSYFMRAILAQVALCMKIWPLLWASYVMFAINLSIFIMLFIFMNVWRWSHSGRVCSGDYLDNLDEADKGIYLITEGKFIKYVLFSGYLIFILSCLSICIVAFVLMGKSDE